MKVNKPETIIPLKVVNGDDPIYDKIKKRPNVSTNDKEPIYNMTNKESNYDRVLKTPLVKDNKQEIYCKKGNNNMKDIVAEGKTETVDTYISVKEVMIVTENIEKYDKSQIDGISSQSQYKTPGKVLSKESSKEYFENLVNILEEAIRDISR